MLIDVVGEYENSPASIGYTYKYYIDTLQNENIKLLKINDYTADDENLRNNSILTTNYYGVMQRKWK